MPSYWCPGFIHVLNTHFAFSFVCCGSFLKHDSGPILLMMIVVVVVVVILILLVIIILVVVVVVMITS